MRYDPATVKLMEDLRVVIEASNFSYRAAQAALGYLLKEYEERARKYMEAAKIQDIARL